MALKATTEEEENLAMKVGELKAIWEEAKAKLDELEKKFNLCSKELSSLTKEKSKLIKKAETAEIEGRKMAVKISKYHTEKVKAEKLLTSIMNKHPWIETEKEAFGVHGGDYDFEKTCPEDMSRHLKALEAEQSLLVSLFIITPIFLCDLTNLISLLNIMLFD